MDEKLTHQSELERIQSRIHKNDFEELERKMAYWHFKNVKVVFIFGNYDILDKNRIEFLARVADFGDRLVVGIRSDEALKKFRPEKKMINSEYTRATVLASLRFVSRVEIIDNDHPHEFIKFLKPTVFIDSKKEPKETQCYETVIANGGRVELLDEE